MAVHAAALAASVARDTLAPAASPFHHIHHAARSGYPSAADAWLHAWINLVWLAFIAFSIWWGFTHVPQVHDFIEQAIAALNQALQH